MGSFKIGDKVKLISNKYTDAAGNPLWGGEYGYIKGVIVDNDSCDTLLPIKVEWDNGIFNYYDLDDLKQCFDLPESLFEL